MKIQVGSAAYTVLYEDNPSHGDQTIWGLTDRNRKQIKVATGQQKLQELHTVMHEYFHAALSEYSLIDTVENTEAEERLVDLLSLALIQSLKSSPKFKEYFIKAIT